jgi:hypothetical protein
VIVRTLEATLRGETHWSGRGMAKASGLGRTTIRQIWRALACSRIAPRRSSCRLIRRSLRRSETSSACMQPPTRAVADHSWGCFHRQSPADRRGPPRGYWNRKSETQKSDTHARNRELPRHIRKTMNLNEQIARARRLVEKSVSEVVASRGLAKPAMIWATSKRLLAPAAPGPPHAQASVNSLKDSSKPCIPIESY